MEEIPTSAHRSVMLNEVLEALSPHSNGSYLDATFGGGGHSRVILAASRPEGQVVAIDRDASVKPWADRLSLAFGKRFRFEPMSYESVAELNCLFDGALLDLGLSTDQLEQSGRGFSFQRPEEPLDMRFDQSGGSTASDVLRQSSLTRLESIFRDLAEDRHWRGLAAKVVRLRREQSVSSVNDFVSIVGTKDPKVLAPLFQGLRMAVNDELGVIKRGLEAISQVLQPKGRLVVISFHSLEDRLVKNFFRSSGYQLINKKPSTPSAEEIASNPRSRSAKLRAGVKE